MPKYEVTVYDGGHTHVEVMTADNEHSLNDLLTGKKVNGKIKGWDKSSIKEQGGSNRIMVFSSK